MLYISNVLIGKTDPFVLPSMKKHCNMEKIVKKKCHVYSCNFIAR